MGNENNIFLPCIEQLHVRNYRVLKNVTLEKMTPLTVLIGTNGSGKSTVFDALAFVAECFSDGLRKAWERRGRFCHMRSRDQDGPIVIEIQYRENPDTPLITYHLEIDEQNKVPVVKQEFMRWKPNHCDSYFNFLDYQYGRGSIVVGNNPESNGTIVERHLSASDVLAVNTLGMLAENPRVAALRQFINSWHISCFSADAARGYPDAGAEMHLSPSGNNLPNVIQYLQEQHPERLLQIFETMRRRIPIIDIAKVDVLSDNRLMLLFSDTSFSTPMLSRFVSDGTIKMLVYLTMLYDPEPQQLIGIENVESYLHPRLLPELAEDFQMAAERTQLIVTTHSPFFINQLPPDNVWIFFRGDDGYTMTRRVVDMRGIPAFLDQGAKLGDLWMEGHFDTMFNNPRYSSG